MSIMNPRERAIERAFIDLEFALLLVTWLNPGSVLSNLSAFEEIGSNHPGLTRFLRMAD
ncbi:hypothetical protein L218DRAFT_954290 [Marasmius fiardii PR-910]|nr:hypothetical protein L218DRAFT_954290 [Marasmius fiardii PR-910]